MKTSIPCLVVLLICSAGASTAAPSTVVPRADLGPLGKTGEAVDKKDSTKPPFKGMTKAQALKAYGDPDSIGHRDGAELWTYVLNRGENYGKSFIPFNFNNKLGYRLLTFRDGRVVEFRWDAPNEG